MKSKQIAWESGMSNVAQKSRQLASWIPGKKNKISIEGLKKDNSVEVTFHECTRFTIFVGQMFSLMPFQGILYQNPTHIKFVRTSWRCLYSLISLIGQIFIATMCIYNATSLNASLKSTTPVIFYGLTCVSMVIFYFVAKSWPELIQQISKTEEIDPNLDNRLFLRCNIACSVILGMALVEHIMSLVSAFAATKHCYPNLAQYEGFVKYFYPWVFDYIPYSVILGLITQFLHFQSTFIWNFSDLFVIVMSFCLTSRLQQINKKLILVQGKYLPEAFWRSAREEYGRATQLVRKVDEVISSVVFLSFANNLFFICLQLFNTLENGFKGRVQCSDKESNPPNGYESAAYFIFSLVYLISRSIAVSLISAEVNTASTTAAPVLYDVPSPVYCVEVQRFLDQINGDKVALTGLQFFSVTRGLLLTVAGTIVTYELVMVQFSAPTPTSDAVTTTMATLLNSTRY